MAQKRISKRSDGRSPEQIRPVKIKTGVNRYAEGSCLIEMGHTRVLCLASCGEDLPEWRKSQGLGWVTAEYAMIPRATHTRSERESVKGKVKGRTQEISRLVGRALRSVVDFRQLGPRTVTVDCEVLQADGGTRCAAITGAYVALHLACKKLQAQGLLKKFPLRDFVAAISVGMVQNKILLDLAYEEDSQADVDMNVVMVGEGQFVEIQGTAENRPFSPAQAQKMLKSAGRGIQDLVAIQKKVLKK